MSSSYEDQIRVLREIEEQKQRAAEYQPLVDSRPAAVEIQRGDINFRALDGMMITAGVEPDYSDLREIIANTQPIDLNRPTRELPNFNVAMYTVEEYDNMKVYQLATHLRALKNLKDEIKALHTAVQNEYEFLSVNILPERMDDEGIETLKIKDVGRLQSTSDIRCNVPAANREALQEWLIDAGFESMVRPDVNSSTLKAFVKECIASGKPYPEELLKVTPFTRASVVKS